MPLVKVGPVLASSDMGDKTEDRLSPIPFLNLSSERFTQFVERLEAVVRRINATPSLSQPVRLKIERDPETLRPMTVVVWQTWSHPLGTFSVEKLQVMTGWFLTELKRDLWTAEFFRGYPR